MQWQPLALFPLSGAVVALIVGCLAWRVRARAPAARYLTLMTGAIALWGLMHAIGAVLTSLTAATAFGLAIFPEVGAVVLGLLWFAQSTADARFRPTRRQVAWLCLEPIAITILAATNPLHHLIFASSAFAGSPALATHTVGPVFWLHSIYSYVLIVRALMLLVAARRTGSVLHRRQITMVLVGVSPPILANIITMIRFSRGSSVDLAVLGFTVASLSFLWALRAGMLRIVPLARTMVMDRVSDAVVVVNSAGQILDVNPAARTLAGLLQPESFDDPVGRFVGDYLGDLPAPAQQIPEGEHTAFAHGNRIQLDVRTSELADARGFLLGRVYAIRDVTELNERQLELSEANAHLQAQLVTIDHLREDLAEQAVRDYLTGLFNRRYLNASLDAAIATAQADGTELAVALLDVDHFKHVNDRFGHAIGDEMLIAIADALRSGSRAGDVAARYGGEEFVVIWPGSSPEEALRRAEGLRQRCADAVVHSGTEAVRTTVSVGVASFPQSAAGVATLLGSADRALYAAKHAGRDQVMVATSQG